MSEFEQTERGFPHKVGRLTFKKDAPDNAKGKLMAVYSCECGKEVTREREGMRTAKRRAINSGCKACVRAQNKVKLKEATGLHPRARPLLRVGGYGQGEIIHSGPRGEK